MEYIKNPVTAKDLIALYKSDLYQELLQAYNKVIPTEFTEENDIQAIEQFIQSKFVLLNIPIEEVISSLEANSAEFIAFSVKRNQFYEDYTEENLVSEFNNGYLDEEEKSQASDKKKKEPISKTFLLHNFCEFYLLKNDDNERTIRFLKRIKMPFVLKHLSEIEKIYNSLSDQS